MVGVEHDGPTARAQNAGELLDRRLRIGDVLQHPLAPEHVDAAIGERQVGCQAVDEADSR